MASRVPSVQAYRVVLERLDSLRGRGHNLSNGWKAATRSWCTACPIAASPAVSAFAVRAMCVAVGVHGVGCGGPWRRQRSGGTHVCSLFVGAVAHSRVHVRGSYATVMYGEVIRMRWAVLRGQNAVVVIA
jgi:hypothetical protein